MNNNSKGIKSITLIIIVIILLILIGSAVLIAINGENLFSKSSEEKNSFVSKTQKDILISKDLKTNNGKGYIGYYADFDGKPGVDGIIYADLLTQYPRNNWYNINGEYTLPNDVNETNVKDYVISSEPITDERFERVGSDPSTYTARYVIKPTSNSQEKKDRFYVMSLDEQKRVTWYDNASGNLSADSNKAVQTCEFGKGETNTNEMIEIWDSDRIWRKKQ